MINREMDESENPALEKAVRALLSSSRGKKSEDIFANPDLLADYVADAYLVVRALESDNNFRFLQICQILSTKTGKSSVSAYVKTQLGGGPAPFSGRRMIEA